MPSFSTLLLFAGVSFLLVATPGPGVLYIVGRSVDQGRRPASDRRIFAEGFLVQLLNPKVAVFFVAYFPQFLDTSAALVPQVLLLGTLYVSVAVISDLIYVFAASRLASRLRGSARARLRFARGSAVTYVALGVLAAVSGNRASASAAR